MNPTVFYISPGGVLKVVKWEHGVWSDPVTIPGNPVGPLDVSADGSHVVYAEADGQIRNTWRGTSGAWHANDLPGSGSPGARKPLMGSGPAPPASPTSTDAGPVRPS